MTNEIYPVNVTGFFTQGFDSLLMASPRMWGFRLRYNFAVSPPPLRGIEQFRDYTQWVAEEIMPAIGQDASRQVSR